MVEKLLDFLVGILGLRVMDKEGDFRKRNIPPREGGWDRVGFEKRKDKDSSVVSDSLS